ANRGEIACRVLRAARELGLPTVAIYSEADADALHVTLADEAICVGPAASAESYLVIESVLGAAKQTGATIIHPGYGFLSEKPDFREACEAAGIRFAGPPADAMRKMGVKTLARQTMMAAGVPVVPGTAEGVQGAEEAGRIAAEIGYPVMLKAASGGGGKGMRLVERAEDLAAALAGAQREAASSFADDTVYIEKFVVRPRHVEVQVLADAHGNCIHVFDRECSVQRRNQKVIEESPAPHLSDATRHAMGEVAVAAARAVDYVGAGTIEFLVDPHENFYFMEMNTRLQVEHPVTELVTGVDLVVEMLRVAMGETLSIRQQDVRQRGHAIECRIYAEDPAQNFLPSPGKLEVYRPARGPGVRVDDGVVEGSLIPRFYDPMIAKLSVWAPTRELAVSRMDKTLLDTEIGGIAHNVPYLRWLLAAPAFAEGRYDTGIVASLGAYGQDRPADPAMAALAAVLHARAKRAARPAATTAGGERTWSRASRAAALMGGRG
ncbi:MAG: acetyl-CoA carboxylase biotin carboxylase subunit, partial [Deltaproteobacteria bacterium]|nr:acetyl-CoA carboxylase biotin carboxylase subunit [Deltaproteobacteria bacterium]